MAEMSKQDAYDRLFATGGWLRQTFRSEFPAYENIRAELLGSRANALFLPLVAPMLLQKSDYESYCSNVMPAYKVRDTAIGVARDIFKAANVEANAAYANTADIDAFNAATKEYAAAYSATVIPIERALHDVIGIAFVAALENSLIATMAAHYA